MYTMRDVSDAELTSRVQHLVPWVQDVLDQARERQALLDTLRQQRKAVSAGPTAVPQMPPSAPPADLQALIQQAVQQALAAQQPPSNSQTLANSQVSEAETPAVPEGWCDLHHIAMERRSNARGSWWSHWIAREQRYCKGKASRRPQTFPRPGGARPRPTRGGAQMTTTTPGIQVGSLALATRASGVCDVGERGVCFEVYTLGGRPGFSFLFEQGRYDGFSPEDVAMFLMITGEVCAAVADYRFTNVIRLQRDWTQGRFAAAFPPQPSPLPRTGPANATSTARGS
jgi:hypothetical protein